MTLTAADHCPYCGRTLFEGNGPTRDHIFVKSLGGRAIVIACHDCNSRIGSDIEGQLLKAGTALNLVQQAYGRGQPLRGRIGEDGPEIEYRLGSTEVHFRKPVSKASEGEVTTYRVTVGAKQSEFEFKKIVKGIGLGDEQAAAIWASRSRQSLAGQSIEMNLAYDLGLARRLAAKVTLGACWSAFADDFAGNALALELRTLLWGAGDLDASAFSSEALGLFDHAIIERYGLSGGAAGMHPVTPNATRSQVVLYPCPGGLAVIVHLAGWDLTLTGAPILFGSLPVGGRLPVILQDGSPSIIVRDIEAELPAALFALYGSLGNDGIGNDLEEPPTSASL